MIERIEELLDNDLVCAMAKGVCIVMAIVFGCMTVAFAIAALGVHWAWVFAMLLVAVLCGMLFGLWIHLMETY
jgi:hypothetical protein